MLPLIMQVKNLHYWCTQAWILNCIIALWKPGIASSRSHPLPIHDVHVTDRASLGVVCVCVWALHAFYCRNRAHESVCGQCSYLSSVHSMQLSMCYCCTVCACTYTYMYMYRCIVLWAECVYGSPASWVC